MILEKHAVPAQENAVFSILIPTWNSISYLKLCIESINKNSRFKHQIIIHINEGSDGTLDFVRGLNYDFTYSQQNIGICYALNACRTLVNTDYIVYLNDDMFVCPDWDKALLDQIKEIGTNYFYFSGSLIEPLDTKNPCCISPYNYGQTTETFDEQKLIQEYENLPHADWNGASWPPSIVHKDIWDLVGGYSAEFSPGMYSDPDFSMKLYLAGVRIFKGISKCRVYHFMCKSTNRIKKNNGRKAFLLKYGVTSRLFYNEILQFGKKYSGEVTIEPTDRIWERLRCVSKFKMFFSLLKK